MKRQFFKIRLTEAQIKLVSEALFEWGQCLEDGAGSVARRDGRRMGRIKTSMQRQMIKQRKMATEPIPGRHNR